MIRIRSRNWIRPQDRFLEGFAQRKKRQFLLNLYHKKLFSLCRRSANAVLVRELQAKVDKGENIEFELQVKKPLVET